MSENEKNVPKRRFKEFENAEGWQQRKVSDITLFHKQGFYTTEEYDDSKKYYLLRGTDLTENRLQIKDTPKINATEKEYKDFKAQKGDFLVVRSGTVGTYGIVNEDIEAIYGSYLIDFRFDKKIVTNEFFGFFYQSHLFRTQLRQIIQQSANTNINAENIKSVNITLPSINEQKRIAEVLSHLDNLITLHQRKLEKMKALKKAYLTEMFPAEGERKPKLRFAGFTDDWEQCKLGDLSESFEYGLNAAAMEFDGKNKYIRITDIDDESREFLNTDLTSPNIDLSRAENFKLQNGDIVFARTGASVGKSYIYKDSDGLVYYAGFLIRARIKPKYSAEFVFQNTLTAEYNKFIRITSQRSGQPGVNAQEYCEYALNVPKFEEQTKIGTFFRNIDDLINVHQHKLEKLQNIKKAYLNEMFI
nr:restriction endonuclease subunit S [Clostridium botulinum]